MSVEDELEPINLNMFKGNNADWKCTVINADDNVVDITSATVTFRVKDSLEGNVLFSRTSTGGSDEIEKTDATNGEFVIKVIPANTENLDTNNMYYYDLEIDLDGIGVKTVAYGVFTLNAK